jgi:hypothetical protein
VAETIKELESEMEPKDMTELLQFHDKNLRTVASCNGATLEDSVNTTETKTKDKEYCIDLVDKAVARFQRTDSILKTVLLWIKQHWMLQRNLS